PFSLGFSHHQLNTTYGIGENGINRYRIFIFQPTVNSLLFQSSHYDIGVNIIAENLGDDEVHKRTRINRIIYRLWGRLKRTPFLKLNLFETSLGGNSDHRVSCPLKGPITS